MNKILTIAAIAASVSFAQDCSVFKVSAIDPAIAAKFTTAIGEDGHDRYVFDLTYNGARVKVDIQNGAASAFNASHFCVAMYTEDSLSVGSVCSKSLIDYGEALETEYVPQGFRYNGINEVADLVKFAVLEVNE